MSVYFQKKCVQREKIFKSKDHDPQMIQTQNGSQKKLHKKKQHGILNVIFDKFIFFTFRKSKQGINS